MSPEILLGLGIVGGTLVGGLLGLGFQRALELRRLQRAAIEADRTRRISERLDSVSTVRVTRGARGRHRL